VQQSFMGRTNGGFKEMDLSIDRAVRDRKNESDVCGVLWSRK